MNIEYRKIEYNDFNSLKELLSSCFDLEIKKICNDDNQYNLVAIYDSKVVGHLLFTKIYNPVDDIYWGKIDYVCVHDDYRNMKIATNLLDELERIEKNIKYFELTSNEKRIIANHLYQKLGYTIVNTNLFRKFRNI